MTDLALSISDQAALKAYEKTIESTKGAFVECGNALAKIRDGRLYRQSNDTFEEYCQIRWGWERAHAYRLIEAAEIVLSPMGYKIKNERQARELSKVTPERREEVLKKAESSGKLTAASISKAAEEVEEAVQVDKLGRIIPQGILEDWNKAEEVKRLLSQISDIRCHVRDAIDGGDITYFELTNACLADFSNCYNSLKMVVPYAVCTTCQGHNRKKCTMCGGRGFISEFRYKQCVPMEIKKMLEKGKK